MNQPRWFVSNGDGKTPHGPNSVDAILRFIRDGIVAPDRQVRLESGPWFRAVDVPVFAPEFRSAVRLAS